MSDWPRQSLWRFFLRAASCAALLTAPSTVSLSSQLGEPEILRDKRWLLVLAHLDDKVEGGDDATYREAVRAFQASQGLPKTGKLTTAHRQLLAERALVEEQRAGYRWLICERTGMELRVPTRMAPRLKLSRQGSQWSAPDDRFLVETFKFPANERVASLRQRFAPGKSLWQDADGNTEVSIETVSGARYILFKAYKGEHEIRAVRVSFDVSQKDRFNAAMNVVGDSITPYPAPAPKRPLPRLTTPGKLDAPKVTSATIPERPPQKTTPAPEPVVLPQQSAAPAKSSPEVGAPIRLNPTPQVVAPQLLPAVPPITGPTPSGPQVRFGSGFIINKVGQVVTNEQTVRSCLVINVRSAGVAAAARVRFTDPTNDLAVLEVSGLKDRAPLALARSETPLAANQSVVILGFAAPDPPGGGGLTATSGTIRPVKFENTTQLQFSGPLKSGQTGGPMLDQFGRVVGVATTALTSIQPGFMVNADALAGFLKTANVPFTAAAASWVVRGEVVVEEAKAAIVQITCELPESTKAK
jgi:S1-C subfamily serine protease